MIKFCFNDYLHDEKHRTDRDATLVVPWKDIDSTHLSVANRTARNRTSLYQKKHAGAAKQTRYRPPELGALNWPIAQHYQLLTKDYQQLRPIVDEYDKRVEKYPPVVGIPISDLTANPLRPHYIAEILTNVYVDQSRLETNERRQFEFGQYKRGFHSEQTDRLIYGSGSDARLFHLEDEPIGKVPYTVLFAFENASEFRLAILHDIVIRADGFLPESVPREIRDGLRWWAACPPLLRNGTFEPGRYAVRDYDVRHFLGFKLKDEELEEKVYQFFGDWDEWCDAIGKVMPAVFPEGYHAALGITNDEVIVVHCNASPEKIAEDLKSMGVRDAVLLDSGGSCAVWANWLNHGDGGVLAHAWNFRAHRGAILFFVLKGVRLRESER